MLLAGESVHLHEYNASNVSQNVAKISILGNGADLYNENPSERYLGSSCSDNGVNAKSDTDRDGDHYLRGIKMRNGYLFIIDYMDFENLIWPPPEPGQSLLDTASATTLQEPKMG